MTPPNANQILQIKWPQIISLLVTFLSAAIMQWVMMSNRLTAIETKQGIHDKELQEVKAREKESTHDVVLKLDKIQEDVNAIKIELERKQNRQ